MKDSPFFRQYDPGKPNGLARADALQGTNMALAFEREDRPVSGTPAPQPTSAPAGDAVEVLSSDLAQDPTTKHWIGYGEVQNNSSSTITASVRLNVFDLNERPLAVNEEDVSVAPLAPGQVSPFYLDFGRLPDGVDHFTTEAHSAPTSNSGVSGLRVSGKREAEDEDRVVVTGAIENRSGDHVKDVRVAVSFYNEDDELLDVWQGTPVSTTIKDGEQMAFEAVTSLSSPRDVERYAVYVVGFRGLPSPEPEDDVAELKSSRIEVDEGNTLHVLGEVNATTEDSAVDVNITAVFYDSEDKIVGAGSAKPVPVRVAPESTAPFEMELHAPPNGYDRVEFKVLGQRYDDRNTWPQPLEIQDENFDLSAARAAVSGTVHNDTDDDMHDVFVVVTYYNSTGKVVDIASRNLDDPDLGEGDEEAFDLSSRVSGIDSAKARAYGYRE
jgi:hypothetical protein